MKPTKINYSTAQIWHQNCEELLDIYQNDDSLTMDMEWAILRNYKTLSQVVNDFKKQQSKLETKFGSLQADGTYVLDTTSEITMQLYQKELENLKQTVIRIGLEKIDHQNLIGKKGVSLEVMALLDFMIN